MFVDELSWSTDGLTNLEVTSSHSSLPSLSPRLPLKNVYKPNKTIIKPQQEWNTHSLDSIFLQSQISRNHSNVRQHQNKSAQPPTQVTQQHPNLNYLETEISILVTSNLQKWQIHLNTPIPLPWKATRMPHLSQTRKHPTESPTSTTKRASSAPATRNSQSLWIPVDEALCEWCFFSLSLR